MRRVAIFTAGAALVLGSLAIPGLAAATGKTAPPPQSTAASAQAGSPDTEITAQHDGRGRGGYRRGFRHGYRDGYGDSRFRHGYFGYRSPFFYGGYYGGYYGGGGFGCNFDYPCGPNSNFRRYDCTKHRGPDGKLVQDPQCKYDPRCDCSYRSSELPPSSGPAPADKTARPVSQRGSTAQPDRDVERAPGPDGSVPSHAH